MSSGLYRRVKDERPSEMLVSNYTATPRHNTVELYLNLHHREKLKSRVKHRMCDTFTLTLTFLALK